MRFGFSSEEIEKRLLAAVNGAIGSVFTQVGQVTKRVTRQGYAKAQELASQRLRSQRQMYIDALKFEESGPNFFTITLDTSASHLEDGYSSFDMIAAGLARGPASFTKKGKRMVIIPFEHIKGAAEPTSPLHGVKVQIGQPTETTKGDLAADLKRLEEAFGVTGTRKGPSGTAMTGKVWSMRKSETGPRWTFQDVSGARASQSLQINPLLSGITKYQQQEALKSGKTRTRSSYFTFRTAVDEPGSGKWVHPGFSGVHIFKDVEQWMSDQFVKEINDIFSKT